MTHSLPISLLMFGTIAAVLLIAVLLLVRYHRRHDSHPMENVRERNIGEMQDGTPPKRH